MLLLGAKMALFHPLLLSQRQNLFSHPVDSPHLNTTRRAVSLLLTV